jgi:hypothetical protein
MWWQAIELATEARSSDYESATETDKVDAEFIFSDLLKNLDALFRNH